jgi:hypothetical protein
VDEGREILTNCPPDVWDVVEKKIARNILFGDNK